MQTEIGWDNLLQGKLFREWRIYQSEYEAAQTRERKDRNVKMRIEHGHITNPYEKDKHKKQKKKNKSKYVFQYFIERIFVITEEELWIQRNLNRHQSSNKSSYTEIIKVDREIRKLYVLSDEVQPAGRDDYYSTDIEQ